MSAATDTRPRRFYAIDAAEAKALATELRDAGFFARALRVRMVVHRAPANVVRDRYAKVRASLGRDMGVTS